MEISKSAVAIAAAACITAGAAAGYIASRTEGPGQPLAAAAATGTAPLADAVELPDRAAPAAPAAPPAGTVASTRPQPPRPPVVSSATPAAVAAPLPQPAAVEQPAPAAIEPAPLPSLVAEVPRIQDVEAARPAEPAGPELEELVVSDDSVIGLQVETALSSETARVEDEVVARVSRDVKVGDKIAIPAGTKAYGEVMLVERGGRLRERARLGVRFTSLILGDGTRMPISAQPIFREGDAPGRESATKIGGGAIGGAIIGGILGGAKGAAIGSAIGGGAGSAAVMASGRNAATLSVGSPVTIRLQEPVSITVER